jgi:hypothetical protein
MRRLDETRCVPVKESVMFSAPSASTVVSSHVFSNVWLGSSVARHTVQFWPVCHPAVKTGFTPVNSSPSWSSIVRFNGPAVTSLAKRRSSINKKRKRVWERRGGQRGFEGSTIAERVYGTG